MTAMASSTILLRRTLRALSSFHRTFSASSSSLPIPRLLSSATPPSPPHSPNFPLQFQSRSFKSSSVSLLSTRSSPSHIPDEIGPDTILFEGCDYNHWLFVMDFPKDNKPSPEEMVRTYEETCAKGLNISVEEAKQKIYACSTTTYTGFQAVMTEEESKKFEGLPGVIFVLPDSYIDPVNKQYGGDQYINGTIIPRPPPVQFGRNQGRRDRRGPGQYNQQDNRGPGQYNQQDNRGPGQYNQQDNRGPGQYNQLDNPMTRPQGNLSYNNRGPMQGNGRNYGPSPNYPPQQNYNQEPQNYPPRQSYGQTTQSYPPQQNYGQTPQSYPPQQNYGQTPQNYPPQQNSGQAPQNYPPQQNQASQSYPQHQTYAAASQQRYGPASPQYAQQQSFGPPGQGERRNFVPQQNSGLPGQGERRDPMPGHGGTGASEAWNDNFTPSYVKDFKPSYMEDFEQVEQRNYPSKEQSGSQQRYPPPGQGNLTGEGRY